MTENVCGVCVCEVCVCVRCVCVAEHDENICTTLERMVSTDPHNLQGRLTCWLLPRASYFSFLTTVSMACVIWTLCGVLNMYSPTPVALRLQNVCVCSAEWEGESVCTYIVPTSP